MLIVKYFLCVELQKRYLYYFELLKKYIIINIDKFCNRQSQNGGYLIDSLLKKLNCMILFYNKNNMWSFLVTRVNIWSIIFIYLD